MSRLMASPLLRRYAFVAIGIGMAFEVLRTLTNVGGASLNNLTQSWVYMAIEFIALAVCAQRALTRREQRLAWSLMTFALACWSIGDLLWAVWLDYDANPPYPSVADGFYLLMYPTMYVALMLLIRERIGRGGAAQWLDGGVVALAMGAVGAGAFFSDIFAETTGHLAADALNIAYPALDLILLMVVVIAFALAHWRPGRDWQAIGSAVALMALADILFADQSAGGIYVSTNFVNVLYLGSFSVMAVAATIPPVRQRKAAHRNSDTIVLTAVAAGMALTLLVFAAFTDVTPLAVALAAGALVLATIRSTLTYRENVRILRATSQQAVTDALTGLGNRRQLLADLGTFFRNVEGPATLLFFDLNGFKRYNDTYGHGVGDALLVRLGSALSAVIGDNGSAYRLGGDEFCALLDGRYPAHDQLVASSRAALTEHGAGFDVTTSLGVTVIPEEANNADEALRLADERMYADKGSHQRSPVRDVLMQLLTERTPGLTDHSHGVMAITAGVAAQFELDGESLDETLRAAELHDIGKLAIPDAILNKPGPLDEAEWAFMKQHPIIGQRILDAASALAPVGRIVRATHERWDGGGYPDGLKGEDIPLGARIISVCDAYDAMISERCYQHARSHEDALAELRHCAGTQFDSAVVYALVRHFQFGGRPAVAEQSPAIVEQRPHLDTAA